MSLTSHKHFARSGGLLGFAEQVREQGGHPSALLHAVGLGPAALIDPDLYLPYPEIAALLNRAAASCADLDFGLHLGQRQGLEVLGALGSFLCLQATVGEALQLLARHMDFHARGVAMTMEGEGEAMTLSLRFAFAGEVDCGQLGVMSLVQVLRGFAQVQQAEAPLAVELQLATPGDADAYAQAFGCPVHFGSARNSLRYSQALLSRPVIVGEVLRDKLMQQWRGDWQQLGEVSLAQQVGRAITALLPTRECSLESVARMLGLHPRRLQQLLKAAGQPYGEILRQTRQALACQHLQSDDMRITALALSLGYEDVAVFSRAFRQWTGKSPREWRQAS